jgi:hypothetical protein
VTGCTFVGDVESSLEVSESTLEGLAGCGGLGEQRAEFGVVSCEALPFGDGGRLTLARLTQLLLEHLLRRSGPCHAGLVVSSAFSQRRGRDAGSRQLAMLRILERSLGLRELLLDTGAELALLLQEHLEFCLATGCG